MDFLHNNSDLAYHISKQEFSDFLTQHTELDQAQADNMIDTWQKTYEALQATLKQQLDEAKQTASVVANQSTKAMERLAWMSFLMLVSGGIFASFGAICSKVK